jgi:hypothetical protein
MASLIASRTAALSSSNKAQPSNSRGMVDLAVAAVLHRRCCRWSNCLMRFCEQFTMPTRLIQTQDLLVTPVHLGQGGDHQDPSREIQRVWLHLVLVLAGLATGSPLGLVLLFLTQPKSDQAQLDALVGIADPDRTARDAPCGRLQSIRATPGPQWRRLAHLPWETWRG